METPPSPEPVRRKQALQMRVFWFLAGSGVNYLLISTPFKYLRANTDLSTGAVSAIALATSTLVFFFWNYFVNFRTDSRKRDAGLRYIVAVAIMYSLSTLLLSFLKHHDFHHQFSLGHFPLDLDIIATQFFLAGVKFPLYNYWAFPVKTTKALGDGTSNQ
ncbi:MAG TPA: GtrA family protein [Chthoniobacteraceae bacterium]|jgi:hypothetical protein|nr:GtrA family protein [Chthoniobacteraceae bacterium]